MRALPRDFVLTATRFQRIIVTVHGIPKSKKSEITEEMIPERYNSKTELTTPITSSTRDLKLELHSKR